MASPFAVFRRNQKIMIAVLGVAAMIAFVFLDPLTQYLGQGQAADNPVVVETRYGNYKESDLMAIRETRELVDAFLVRAAEATIDAQIEKGQFDARMRQQMVENWYMTWRQRLMTRSAQGPEAAAVETMILAGRAREMGMVVSDQTINDMLAELTFDALTSNQLLSIINSLHAGQRVSPARLFEAIRTELLASNLGLMFQVSTVDFPPAQKFEFFSRLNRQAKAEVVPLAVVDFTSQVKNPSDEVLKKFFDKYKNDFPNAQSPEPGFKEPPRAAFQFFKADFVKLTEEMKAKVTDAEIGEYYEKNKAQFLALDLPEEPADDKPADAPAEQKADEPAPEGEPKSEDSKPSEEPAAEAPKSEPAAPEAAPAEPPAAEKPAAGDAPKESQSSRRSRGVLRLVSTTTQAEEAAPATSEPAAAPGEPAAEPNEPAAAPGEPAPEPGTQPASEPPAADAEPAPAAEAASDEKPAADAAAADAKPAEPRYEPLEKVRDQIRDSLAGQKAAERIGEIFDELQSEMRRYADQVDIYNTREETDTTARAPEPFPFAELAKKYAIDAAELPLVSATEISSEELGKVARIVADRRSQFGFRRETFPEFAFSESLATYKATVVNDAEGNGFLFWKTKEQEAYVPTLDKARDKVLAAWKMIEARPLARKRAEELAKQADAANKPLKEVFADQPELKVLESGSFSWLTRGNVPENPMGGPVRISEIEGLEHIGNGFMEAVFALPAGTTGVAANEPQDTVYVVRVSEYEPELEQLRDQFAKERPQTYMTVAQTDRYEMYTTWVDNLEKEARIHWVRTPDLARNESDEDEAEL
ncbi:MAG: hypothetical protein WD845_10005 [Pirellulales bacterium]